MEIQDPSQDINLNQLEENTLTKHFKIHKSFPPLYTGGSFYLWKDEKHAFSLRNNEICVFNIEFCDILSTISQENEETIAFSISPNFQFLALSNKNYLIKIFKLPQDLTNLDSQLELVKTFKTHGQMVLEINFDPTSKFVACGTADSHIKVYDVVKGFQTHNFTGHRGIINKLVFYPEIDSLKLISSAEDSQIKVWDLVMRSEVLTIKAHSSMVTAIEFSQDKQYMITGSKDGNIGLFNVRNNFSLVSIFSQKNCGLEEEEINSLVYYTVRVNEVNRPYIIVGGKSGQLSVLEINKQKICFRTQTDSQFEITQLIYLPKKNQILSINSDQNLGVYEISKKNNKKGNFHCPILRIQETKCLYLDEIIDLKFIKLKEEQVPSKALLCSNNEILKLYDIQTGNTDLIYGHTDIILCLDIKNDLFLTGAKDNQIRLWKFNESHSPSVKCIAVFKGHNQNVSSVCFAPKKSNFFASVSQDNTLKLWDISKLKSLNPFELLESQEVTSATMTIMGHSKYINSVKISPNDKMIASSSQDKCVNIWSSSNLTQLASLKGHKKGVWDIAFSPVDKLLVSASGDKTLKLWNLQTFTCVHTFQGHQQALVKVSWMNFGLQIISGGVDGVVKIWNFKKQTCINTFEMHEEKIWALDIQENYLITGGGDSTLKVWQDCTIEKEREERVVKLQRIQDEQKLSNLIREQDFIEAAVLSFKLNKLRDFYLILNKIISGDKRQLDQTDIVLEEKKLYEKCIEEDRAQKREEKVDLLSRVLLRLLKEDKKRLMEIIRNMNTKQEYVEVAHNLLGYLLPKIKVEDYLEDFKEHKKDFQDLLQVLEFYSEKHFERADRELKKAYFIDYVLQQMTVDEDLVEEKRKFELKEQARQLNEIEEERRKKKRGSAEKRVNMKRGRMLSDNLFDEENKPQNMKRIKS